MVGDGEVDVVGLVGVVARHCNVLEMVHLFQIEQTWVRNWSSTQIFEIRSLENHSSACTVLPVQYKAAAGEHTPLTLNFLILCVCVCVWDDVFDKIGWNGGLLE